MARRLDRVTILYVVGILLGVVATGYFGFRLLEDLSPVTTAALLLVGFVLLLIAGIAVGVETLDLVLYALSAGAYLVFVAYTIMTFELGDGGTFLLLALSSVLFIALGYLAHRNRLALSRRQARLGALLVVVLAIALVGVDVTGAQPAQSADFETDVPVPGDREMVHLGTATVSNDFVLPRSTTVQRYHACVYTPDRELMTLSFAPSAGSILLGGGETRTYDVRLSGHVFYREGELREAVSGVDRVPVERAETCPADADAPRIVVVEDRPEPVR